MKVEKICHNQNAAPKEISCFLDAQYYKGTDIHFHNMNEIMYVASGEVINTYENSSHVLRQYQMLFTRAKDIHSCHSSDISNLAIYTINIPDYLFNTISKFYNQDTSYILNSDSPTIITLTLAEHNQILTNLVKASDNKFDNLHGQYILNILSNAFFYLYNHAPNLEKQDVPSWFSVILSKICIPENFIEGMTKLHQITHYSDEYISRCFKKYLGVTPTMYINNLRLDYAAKLLIQDKLNIIDIGDASGFSNEGYFYKCFKERFNCTPKEYKKNYK